VELDQSEPELRVEKSNKVKISWSWEYMYICKEFHYFLICHRLSTNSVVEERMEAVKRSLVEENGGLRGELARLKAELDSQVRSSVFLLQPLKVRS